MANRELACVAGVWKGREREFWEREFQAREKREGRARKQTRAWSRALIPFPFPFERLPRRLIGSFSNDDGDVNKSRKSNSFWLAKRQLCTCLTLFCTFLCHHCATTTLQCLISHDVLWSTRTQDNGIHFIFLNFDTVFYNSTPEKTANIWRNWTRWNKRNKVWHI